MRPIGGFSYLRSSLIETAEGRQAILAGLSLGLGIPFPGKRETGWRETGSTCGDYAVWRLRGGQTEHAVLMRPFGRKFAETRDTHSMGLDGCLDEVGCKEGKRERMLTLRTLQLSC
jgi:hypothetical protein